MNSSTDDAEKMTPVFESPPIMYSCTACSSIFSWIEISSLAWLSRVPWIRSCLASTRSKSCSASSKPRADTSKACLAVRYSSSCSRDSAHASFTWARVTPKAGWGNIVTSSADSVMSISGRRWAFAAAMPEKA